MSYSVKQLKNFFNYDINKPFGTYYLTNKQPEVYVNMQVSELMNSHVISVTPDETASLAARLLHRHNIGSLPVCEDDGKLKGILTDRDIVLRCVAAETDPQKAQSAGGARGCPLRSARGCPCRRIALRGIR